MFQVGDKVICVPVMPGLEDLVGLKGVIKEKLSDTLYAVKFGRTKIVKVSDKELKPDDETPA
jgi:hypothetical protein